MFKFSAEAVTLGLGSSSCTSGSEKFTSFTEAIPSLNMVSFSGACFLMSREFFLDTSSLSDLETDSTPGTVSSPETGTFSGLLDREISEEVDEVSFSSQVLPLSKSPKTNTNRLNSLFN